MSQSILDETSDAELVALARGGDKEAFGRLIDRYRSMAERVARRTVANADLAQELAQKAMVEAYLSLDHLREPASFRNWLYGIVLNVCRSHARHQRAAPLLLSIDEMEGGMQLDAAALFGAPVDPHEVAEQRELGDQLLQAVNSLSPKNRAAARLFYYKDMSVQEIAEALDASPAAVKVRLHRARRQLRERLAPPPPEAAGSAERREQMIEVSIADVVEMDTHPWTDPMYVVKLLDEKGQRILPIWVGVAEGQAIARHILDHASSRPLTHDLAVSLLQAAGVALEEVHVVALRENTYYATVKLRAGKKPEEVDARPSDGIALALRAGRPIYVAQEVMDASGVGVPDDEEREGQLGRGLDAIRDKLDSGTDESLKQLQRSLALYQALGERTQPQERRAMTEHILRDATAIAREINDRESLANGLLGLGYTLGRLYRPGEACPALEECTAVFDDLGQGDLAYHARALLARAHVKLGQYEKARAVGQALLEQGRESDVKQMIGYALLLLGKAALAQGAYAEALDLLQESSDVFPDPPGTPMWAQADLGLALCGLGRPSEAEEHLREALRIAATTGGADLSAGVLSAVALFLSTQGEHERAVELYALASRCPVVANSRWFEDVVGWHVAAAAAALPEDVAAAARGRGRARDLEATIAELAAEMEE